MQRLILVLLVVTALADVLCAAPAPFPRRQNAAEGKLVGTWQVRHWSPTWREWVRFRYTFGRNGEYTARFYETRFYEIPQVLSRQYYAGRWSLSGGRLRLVETHGYYGPRTRPTVWDYTLDGRTSTDEPLPGWSHIRLERRLP